MKEIEILKYKKFIERINEGLIHTYSLSHIDSYFRISLQKMITDFDLVIDNNKKVFNLELRSNLEKIPLLLDFINNYGYFPSFIYLETNNSFKYKDDFFKNFNYSNFKSIKLICEPKYGDIIEVNKLYHVTPSPNLSTILKLGLYPRMSNKISYTTSRIYFGYDPIETEKLAVKLYNMLDANYLNKSKEYTEFKEKCNIYCLLEINIPPLEKFQKSNKYIKEVKEVIRFYNDPNFNGKGCFTYDNIRPEWVKYIKDITF
jgi:hypothetical protein